MMAKATLPIEMLDPRGPVFALIEHEVAGLAILDHDVVVTTGPPERRANWVGVDRDGRLVLVLFVEAGDERTPGFVLAALAFGLEGRAATAKRWRAANVRVDLEPLVVVVAASYTTRTLRALSFLADHALVVLELRSLERADGTEPFLVRVDFSAGPDDTGRSSTFAAFPATVRGRLERLTRDVKRIDPEIEEQELAGTLRLWWRGDEVARISAVDGVLVIGETRSRPRLALDDEPRSEAWLERFLVEHCARRAGATPTARPLDVLDRTAGPLLSPEELAAFRD